MRILLSPDSPTGSGQTSQTQNPATTAPAAPEPVKSAGVVKKTAIKTPREIELEKALARLEDKVDGLSAWQKEVTDFLADRWIKPAPKATAPTAGATKTASSKAAEPVPETITAAAAAAAVQGVLADVGKELGL